MNNHIQPDAIYDLAKDQSVQVVDVRSPGEFAAGHLPGSMNVPMAEIEARLDDLQSHGPVVLVCQSGRRAGITCDLLVGHRDNLYVLDGGVNSWAEKGLPVVKSVKTRWSLERQVRLGAGLMVLAGVLLGVFVNPLWLILSGFVGAGLTFAGLTDVCGMAAVLALMPWNRPAPSPKGAVSAEAQP